jgi:hypothetical protein
VTIVVMLGRVLFLIIKSEWSMGYSCALET